MYSLFEITAFLQYTVYVPHYDPYDTVNNKIYVIREGVKFWVGSDVLDSLKSEFIY